MYCILKRSFSFLNQRIFVGSDGQCLFQGLRGDVQVVGVELNAGLGSVHKEAVPLKMSRNAWKCVGKLVSNPALQVLHEIAAQAW